MLFNNFTDDIPKNETVQPVSEEQTQTVCDEETKVFEKITEEDAQTPSGEFAQVNFGTEPAEEKKKKKGKALLIACIALVLVAAIVVGMIFIFKKDNSNNESEETCPPPAAVNSTLSTLFSAFSKHNNTPEIIKTLASVYGTIVNTETVAAAADMNLSFDVSDKLLDTFNAVIKASGVEGFDLDWIKSSLITIRVNNVGDKIEYLASFSSGGENLLDAKAIIDVANRIIYAGIPSLSNSYIELSADALGAKKESALEYVPSQADDSTSVPDSAEESESTSFLSTYYKILSDSEIRKILPTEEEYAKILEKVFTAITENLPFDSQKATTLSVGNISQDVTEYTINISKKDIAKTLVALLNAIKDDSVIISSLEEMSAYLESNYDIPATGVAEMFTEGINDAINSINANKISDETIITYSRYVDHENYIVGSKIIADDNMFAEEESSEDLPVSLETKFYQATVKDGENYATVLEAGNELMLTGKGTINGNAKTGTYTVSFDEDTLDFKLKDFSCANGINGSVVLLFPDDITKDIVNNEMFSSLFSSMDMGLELKFTTYSEFFAMDTNIVSGDNVLFGIKMTAGQAPTSEITIPNNIIPADEAKDWADTIDQNKLQELFKKSPFKEIITLLTARISAETELVAAA